MSRSSSHTAESAVARYRAAVADIVIPDATAVAAAGPSPTTSAGGSDWTQGALAVLEPWARAVEELRRGVGPDADRRARAFVDSIVKAYNRTLLDGSALAVERAK
jgi:hypothetical protein